MEKTKKNRRVFLGLILGLILAFGVTAAVAAAPTYKNQIVTENGKQYYYNKNGKKVTKKYGYKIKGNYYKIDKNGVLTKVSKEEGLAGIQLNKYYGQKKSTVLFKAFQLSSNIKYYTNPTKGKNVKYFADYGFERKRGDCNVQAATFYYYAKVLGYKPKFVQGYVLQANGKYGAHAWVTIKVNGQNRVYDPNLYNTYKNDSTFKKLGIKPGYNRAYGSKGTYKYFNLSKKLIKK